MPWNNILQNAKDIAHDYSPSAGQLDGTILENWLMPGNVQQREFGQQVALQEMQNEWNSEAAKMARMKEAGINLNTAASGVAGSGSSPSTGSVPTAVGAGAAGVSSLGSLGSAAAQLGNMFNGGIGTAVDAIDKLFTLHPRRKQLLSEASRNIAEAGFTELQSKALGISLKYADRKEILGLITMAQNLVNMRTQRSVMRHQIKEIDANVKQLDALVEKYKHENNLADAQATEAEKHAKLMEAQETYQSFINNLNSLAKFDTTQPLSNQIVQLFAQGEDDKIDSLLNIAYDYNNAINAGVYDAEADAAFYKAWNEEAARQDVSADYAPYKAYIDVYKDMMHEIYKASFENPNDIVGLISKGFNQFISLIDQIKAEAMNHPDSPFNKTQNKRPRNPNPYRTSSRSNNRGYSPR